MSAKIMRQLRKRVGLSQAEMAALLGFSFRGYQELETGRTAFAPRHLAVLERVSLGLAVEHEDAGLALPSILEDVRRLIDKGRSSPGAPQIATVSPAVKCNAAADGASP